MVFVSGTTGVQDNAAKESDSYEQTIQAITKIEDALKNVDSSLEDVVRTRVFLNRKADWKQVAKAHSEFFGKILPASSMLVCEFLDPKILVEIEADALTG